MDELKKEVTEHVAPVGDFVTQPLGGKVYDPGESITKKMNRNAEFDKDLFFTDLFENYLVCVDRHSPRENPNSGIITRWDESTSFEDFCADSILVLDHKLSGIKMAKEAHAQKFKVFDDSVLSEMKIDAGSSVVGQQFGSEDYDAIEELLRRSQETLKSYLSGHTKMIINSKTGRVRVTESAVA